MPQIVVSEDKPQLLEAVTHALRMYNSPDGQTFRALQAQGASLAEICKWADAASDPASKATRRMLRNMEAYKESNPQEAFSRFIGR